MSIKYNVNYVSKEIIMVVIILLFIKLTFTNNNVILSANAWHRCDVLFPGFGEFLSLSSSVIKFGKIIIFAWYIRIDIT